MPSLWCLEVANVLRNAVRRKRCDWAYATHCLQRLERLPIVVDSETDAHACGRTCQLSDEHDLTVYDASYLELAQRRQWPLASCDNASIKAARAAGVEAMKFYEVAPQLSMTQHAITIRPLCFSTKTFKKLDKNMQAAVLKAGKEAGAYGRKVESGEDEAKLVALEKAGKLTRVKFSDRAKMKQLADPVMAAYAKEIGAEDIYKKINAIK